jgi:DNA-binding beta-propeller fold protein YncE
VAGIAVDTEDTVYIADAANNAIRKITASTGKISTLAGSGTAGYSGDGGPATSAKLSGPWGVAVDAAGNVYIADTGNSAIRMVAK